MRYEDLKHEVLEAAKRCARRGPAYAQQRAVFNAVVEKCGGGTSPPLPPRRRPCAIARCNPPLLLGAAQRRKRAGPKRRECLDPAPIHTMAAETGRLPASRGAP
jgi:hypothetical protein